MNAPDEFIQQLLDDIDRTGQVFAKAKAKADAMRKLVEIAEANLMKIMEAQGIKNVGAQKREARAHPSYAAIVKEWQQAIEDRINAETANENAKRAWESWRTESANERAALRG